MNKYYVISSEIIATYLWNQFKYREYRFMVNDEIKADPLFYKAKECYAGEDIESCNLFKYASNETNDIWNYNTNKDIMTDYFNEKYNLEYSDSFVSARRVYANMKLRKEFLMPDESEVKGKINTLQADFLMNLIISGKITSDDDKKHVILFAMILDRSIVSEYEKDIINKNVAYTNEDVRQAIKRRL